MKSTKQARSDPMFSENYRSPWPYDCARDAPSPRYNNVRNWAFKFSILLTLVFGGLAVRGQEPQPTPTPIPVPTPFPTPVPTPVLPVITVPSKDGPVTTAQTPPNLNAPDPAVYWTVRDAILAALENNVDIAIERKNLRISEFNILAAQGFYDLTFKASPQFSSSKQPNIGRFSGVASAINSTNTKNLNLNAGLDKQIQQTGGSFTSNFDNPRVTSNSGIVSPVYSPQLSFSFTQPLWRNRSIDNNRLQIYVAKKNLTLTDSQFRQQVISVIFQVQQAYWNLADARRNVTVQSDGLALAQKQVDDDQKQVDIGTLAPLEVITVKATLETRRVAYIQAQNAASQAQNVLKNLVADGTQGAIWAKDIFPVDFFEEPSANTTLDDALVSGYANRPEADQFNIQKDIDQLNTRYFRNQTKPQIDLVSSYSITGAGGTPTTSLTCPAGTTLGSNSLCNPGGLPPTVTTASVNSKFVGGYGTALQNLFSNKYNTVTVGVNITFPFRNRTAKAELGKALVTESQTELQERKQLQIIEVDVRNAYQSVLLAKQSLDAARLARQYAEIQLDGEQKKFATGLSTTFLVLTRQNDLIQARGTEVNALAAYNNAVAALQQATGTTLTSNNVEIK